MPVRNDLISRPAHVERASRVEKTAGCFSWLFSILSSLASFLCCFFPFCRSVKQDIEGDDQKKVEQAAAPVFDRDPDPLKESFNTVLEQFGRLPEVGSPDREKAVERLLKEGGKISNSFRGETERKVGILLDHFVESLPPDLKRHPALWRALASFPAAFSIDPKNLTVLQRANYEKLMRDIPPKILDCLRKFKQTLLSLDAEADFDQWLIRLSGGSVPLELRNLLWSSVLLLSVSKEDLITNLSQVCLFDKIESLWNQPDFASGYLKRRLEKAKMIVSRSNQPLPREIGHVLALVQEGPNPTSLDEAIAQHICNGSKKALSVDRSIVKYDLAMQRDAHCGVIASLAKLSDFRQRLDCTDEEFKIAIDLCNPYFDIDIEPLKKLLKFIREARRAMPDFDQRMREWDWTKDPFRDKFVAFCQTKT